jgi:hypothetical protein
MIRVLILDFRGKVRWVTRCRTAAVTLCNARGILIAAAVISVTLVVRGECILTP